MKRHRLFKYILPELLIVLVYVLLINLKVGSVETYIKADGVGYYDYLPALVIHHDLIRNNKPEATNPDLYQRIQKENVYVPYHGYLIDKYPVGTAVLQSPFFLFTYFTTSLSGEPDDGYQKSFQKTVLYAAVFYLFLGLIFLRKLLTFYDIKKWIIIFLQVLAVFGTSITHYANFDAGFSHVYSFFAINAFLYFCMKYIRRKDITSFGLAGLLLGLILILRQINVLILLFIPFLAGSWENLKTAVLQTIHKPIVLLTGILAVIVVFSIQSWAWYVQTGHLFLDSYQGEGFHFLDPQILNILFSYKKGLFVYTPVLVLSLFGLIRLFYTKRLYQSLAWLFFFLVITYLFSSWHSWEYGASYGSRVYIEYYSVFFILIALFLNQIPRVTRFVVVLLSFLFIPLNLIQAYQYKNYILLWTNMDKQKYWQVFLKTDNKYKGLLWKKTVDTSRYLLLKEVALGNREAHTALDTIFQVESPSIPDFEKTRAIRISLINRFSEKNNSKIIVCIKDSASQKTEYWYDPYLIHFNQRGPNNEQRGSYCYEINPPTDRNPKTITVSLFSPQKSTRLKGVKIEFLAQR